MDTRIDPQAANGTAGDDGAVVLRAADGTDAVTVPGGAWLLKADFGRAGPDLMLEGADGKTVIVRDYFTSDTPPDLQTDQGAVIGGDLATRLAGPVAPGQFAQAVPTVGAEPIGKVAAVEGTVTITRATGVTVTVEKDTPVFQGDTVETAKDGAIGITFVDDSTFSLGDEGRMVIDELVYDPGTQEGQFSANLVQGVFSFVSGQIAKTSPEGMVVTTPVATIGIRGTKVAGRAAQEGQENTIALLPEVDPQGNQIVGELSVTNQAGTVTLNQVGATVALNSAFQPPPPPVVVPVDQLEAQFGAALNSLPPSPAQQQDDNAGGGEEQAAEGGDGEPAADGEGQGEGEGEGEPGDGEGQPAEGEGEQLAEGEGEPLPEGEGEPLPGDGEALAEGDGAPVEGQDGPIEGDGAPLDDNQLADAGDAPLGGDDPAALDDGAPIGGGDDAFNSSDPFGGGGDPFGGGGDPFGGDGGLFDTGGDTGLPGTGGDGLYGGDGDLLGGGDDLLGGGDGLLDGGDLTLPPPDETILVDDTPPPDASPPEEPPAVAEPFVNTSGSDVFAGNAENTVFIYDQALDGSTAVSTASGGAFAGGGTDVITDAGGLDTLWLTNLDGVGVKVTAGVGSYDATIYDISAVATVSAGGGTDFTSSGTSLTSGTVTDTIETFKADDGTTVYTDNSVYTPVAGEVDYVIAGTSGNNLFDLSSTSGTIYSLVFGKGGTDTATFANETTGLSVLVDGSSADYTVGSTLSGTLDGIEIIKGSSTAANAFTVTAATATTSLVGGSGNDSFSISAGASFSGTLDGGTGTDTVTVTDGTQSFTVVGMETVIGGSGTDTLTYGIDNMTVHVTGVESVVGYNGNDALVFDTTVSGVTVDMGGFFDTVTLTQGTNDLSLSNTEYVSLSGSSGTNALTLNNAQSATDGFPTIYGSGGTDTVTLGAGGAKITAQAVENVDGGTGLTDLVLSAASNVTVASVSTVTGSGGSDSVTMGAAGTLTVSAVENVTGSAGTDTLVLGAAGTLTVSGVENITGSAGTDVVAMGAAGTVTLSGVETVTGSSGADTITGGAGANTILSGVGVDVIYGSDGNDFIDGGTGDDSLLYSSTAGTLTVTTTAVNTYSIASSGGWTDTATQVEGITGSAQNDVFNIGHGSSSITQNLVGGAGVDTVSFASATVAINASLVDTTTFYGGGVYWGALDQMENLTGSAQADTLTGNTGANTLSGGASTDTLTGGNGADTLIGGDGDDVFFMHETDGSADVVIGGNGTTDGTTAANDGVFYYNGSTSLTITLGDESGTVAGSAVGADIGTDTLYGIDKVHGSTAADTIYGNAAANHLNGEGGDDVIYGGQGNDWIDGVGGFDTIRYDSTTGQYAVNTAVTVTQDTNSHASVTDGTFTDAVYQHDKLVATGFDDTFTMTAANTVTFDGGAGTDTLNMSAESLAVVADLSTGAFTVAGSGYGTLLNIENIASGSGVDTLTGGTGANTLTGGLGGDQLTGGGGGDVYRYTSVTDSINGNSDTIFGFDAGAVDSIFFDVGLGTSTVSWLGAHAGATFTGGSGTLQLSFDDATNTLYADANDDGTAETEIVLDSITIASGLDATDFSVN